MICRCPTCFGSRQVRQLGNMLAPCDTCEGTGTITANKLKELSQNKGVYSSVQQPTPETAEFFNKQRQAQERLKNRDANVAYLNRPVVDDPKRANDAASFAPDKPIIPLDPNIKQAPDHRLMPKPLSEYELEKIRAKVVDRDDSIIEAQRQAIEGISDELVEKFEMTEVTDSESIETVQPKSSRKAKGIAENAKKESKARKQG